MLRYCTTLVAIATLLFSQSSVAYERAVSLAPHITELIYAIEAENTLIATVNSSNYPKAAQLLPRVGDGVSVNAEQLLALNPDVVFAWQPTHALQALEPTLKQSGIALHYIHPQSLTDIALAAEQLGDWLQQPTNAKQRSQQWQQRIRELRLQHHTNSPATVFIALHNKPLYTLNDPVINDVLSVCGVKNWAENYSQVAPMINLEQLLARPFSALIYSQDEGVLDELLRLTATTQNTSIPSYVVDPDLFYRSGPRVFEATETLCSQIQQSTLTVFTD